MKSMYEELKNFPGVVGMIDDTHTEVHRPPERGFDILWYCRQWSVRTCSSHICTQGGLVKFTMPGSFGIPHCVTVVKHCVEEVICLVILHTPTCLSYSHHSRTIDT